MKRKYKEYLYIVLYEETLIAMSDSLDNCIKYIEQFPKLDSSKVYIEEITNNQKADYLCLMFADEFMLVYYREDILLTPLEIKYYEPTFRSDYEDMKITMTRLYWINKVGEFTIEESGNLVKAFETLYGKMNSFSEYINSLKRESIFSIISEPVMTVKSYYIEKEMDDEMYYKIGKK